ncbi:MAG: hypothetical protein L6Q97_16180, partial [Thermoanaerobaculia bacterium]|nr:hypothetical protein [Thermoanaerobaculia bacterium]
IIQIQEVKIVVSSAEQAGTFPVRCYPSPFRENFRVESPGTPLSGIVVYDAVGFPVTEQYFPEQTIAEIPAQHWHSGLYRVKMIAADGRVAVKSLLKL